MIFFFLKGERARSWRTRDISTGGKNLIDINFANIANQVMFIDTIKFFQQSLAALANTTTDKEKQCVKIEYKKFIIKDLKLNKTFKECSVNDQKWVLNYFSFGKEGIPNKMINRFGSLDI